MAIAPLAVSVERALAFRLARQHLLTPAPDPLAAATTLLGAQAQVQRAGMLQLAARCGPGTAAAAAVRRALYRDRSLVKLWAHRSTLHLVPAADLGLVLGLRRFAVAGHRGWLSRGGLSDGEIDRLAAAIAEVLAEGPHSRADLSRRLTPLLGEWARPWLEHSWGGALKLAASMGIACHGPERPREAAFVHVENWVGPITIAEREAALAGALTRYLAAFGPASPADFAKFSGLPAEPVRTAFRLASPGLVPVDLAGRKAFINETDEADLRAAEHPPTHLVALPLFDPWLLAHADTSQTVAPEFRRHIYRTAGWISAVVLRQGRVVATWSEPAPGRAAVVPLARLGKGEMKRVGVRLRALLGRGTEVAQAMAESPPAPAEIAALSQEI